MEAKDNTKESEVSQDETDAKLIGKIFGGDKHENRHEEVVFDKDEFVKEKVNELKIDDDNSLDVLVKAGQDVYPSSGNRRGVCVIIENDMFHTNLGLSKRKGSSVDRQLMVETFTRLQFEVRVFSNLTVKDINNTLEKISLEDHSDRDMLAGIVTTYKALIIMKGLIIN